MTKAERIIEQLLALNPEPLLLEPREVYDAALIGLTDTPDDHWPRKGGTYVAVYSEEKCIDAIMRWMDCTYETAQEWFGFNTSGGWYGEGTPLFRSAHEAPNE